MRSHTLVFLTLSALYVFSSLTSMAIMNIGAGLLLLWTAAHSLKNRTFPLPSFLKDRFLIVSFFALFLSIVCSLIVHYFWPANFHGAQVPNGNEWRAFAKLWVFLIPPALATTLFQIPESSRKIVYRVWLLSSVIVAILALQQVFTFWPRGRENPQLLGFAHADALFGHHLSYANIMIFPFFALLHSTWSAFKARKPFVMRTLLLLASVISLTALFFTYSRILWAVLPIVLLLWMWLRLPKRYATALSFIAGLFLTGLLFLPQIQSRITTPMGHNDRFQLWALNLKFFKEHPLFGVGFRQGEPLSYLYFHDILKQPEHFSGHAHNLYLEQLSTTGAFGLFALILCIASLIHIGVRVYRSSPSSTALEWILALSVALASGLTQNNFWETKVTHQWIIAFCLMVVFRNTKEVPQ